MAPEGLSGQDLSVKTSTYLDPLSHTLLALSVCLTTKGKEAEAPLGQSKDTLESGKNHVESAEENKSLQLEVD